MKHYVLADPNDLTNTEIFSDPTDSDPPQLPGREGWHFLEIAPEDLSGTTPHALFTSKSPIVGLQNGVVTLQAWVDRPAPTPLFTVTQSTDLVDDGSNEATISISGAPASVPFTVSANRPCPCTLVGGSGMLDGNGDASFIIKAVGQDPLFLIIEADGQIVSHEVSIIPFTPA